MFDLLKSRFSHGYQAVKDIPGSKVNPKYRGFPLLIESGDPGTAQAAADCQSQALTASPLSLDIGRCTFCGECARITKEVSFTNFHHTAATSRSRLVVTPGMNPENYKDSSIEVCNRIRSYFGRSLKLRSVSAAGCNACELELNACSNVNFDMGRYGIEVVASPRHADGIVITGPVSENMAAALEDTYNAIPSPKIVIAMGTCAISGGVFAGSPALDRKFFDKVKVDLYVPGCPPHPLTMVNGIIDLIGRKG